MTKIFENLATSGFFSSLQAREDHQNFSVEALSVLDSLVEVRHNAYLFHKKRFVENDVAKDDKDAADLYYISTPHPIGNLSTPQLLLLELMGKIKALDSRRAHDARKYDAAKYNEVLVKYLKETGTALVENYNVDHNQDAAIALELVQSLSLRKRDREGEGGLVGVSDAMEKIAKAVLQIGIPTTVVTQQVQDAHNSVKERAIVGIMAKEGMPSKTKLWRNVDGDGDPDNAVANVLPQGCVGRSLLEIFEVCQQRGANADDGYLYEPRISYKDKKDVVGLKKQVEGIIAQCSVDGHFSYEKFAEFLDAAKYEAVVDAKGVGRPINNPIDTVLRICLPAFVNAHGLVISDFDSSDQNIMQQILLIKEATQHYLNDRTNSWENPIVINQVILPLCESETSVNGAAQCFVDFFKLVKEQYDRISQLPEVEQAREFADLRRTIINENNEFVLGSFSGPSDLTKDIGSSSIYLIKRLNLDLRQQWEEFKQSVPELDLQEAKMVMEYGQGSSTKRDNNSVPHPDAFSGRTIQGTNIVTMHSHGVKHQLRTAINMVEVPDSFMDDKRVLGVETNDGRVVRLTAQDFIDDAIASHRRFLGEGDKSGVGRGLIVAEIDEKIRRNDPLFGAIARSYSNNQGTRGTNIVPPYREQRAIGAAFVTAYTGLLQHNGFPDETLESYYAIEADDINNSAMLLNITLKELYQFLCVDYQRAEVLGFSQTTIKETQRYCDRVLTFLESRLDIATDQNSAQDYRSRVEGVVLGLAKKCDVQSDAFLALWEFYNQIPQVCKNRNQTTEMMQNLSHDLDNYELTQKEKDAYYANIAFAVNGVTNFPLPLIAMGRLTARNEDHVRAGYLAQVPATTIQPEMLARMNGGIDDRGI